MVDGSQPLARTRPIAAALPGMLGRCRVYRTGSAAALRVAPAGPGPLPLSLDGEATSARSGFRIVKNSRQLLVYPLS